MPIYEYQCNECGKRFEVLHKSSTVGSVNCTECHSSSVSKMISAPAAVMVRQSAGHDAGPVCPHAHQCGANCPSGAHSH